MTRPVAHLTERERQVLRALRQHGGPYSVLSPAALSVATGIREIELATVAWALRDPRRLREDLAFFRLSHQVYQLTPAGQAVADGAEPEWEPLLLAGLFDETPDPEAVDALLL